MQLQLGAKTINEIEGLINTNCWKAFFWIHSILLLQLKYLFYYKNQVKQLGHLNVDIRLNEQGRACEEIVLKDVDEHKRKWKKIKDSLRYMSTVIDVCYSRSLIDEEVNDLKRFNSFRNKIGHPEIYEFLPDDSEVEKMCRLGLRTVKKLDKKISDALHNN